MSSFTPHKRLPILLMSTSLLFLSACGEKKVESAGAAVQISADELNTASSSKNREVPSVDYWKPISAYLVGSYGGECVKMPSATHAPGQIVIAADGKLTAGSLADSMLDTSETMLVSTRSGDSGPTFTLAANSANAMVSLMTGAHGKGIDASFMKGENMLICEKSKSVIALATQNFYAVYAKFLDSAPQKMSCTNGGDMKKSDLDYQFGNGIIKLNDETYDLAKMDELVLISGGFSSLSYTASTGTERSVSVSLDKDGKLKSVQTKGKHSYACV